MLKIVKQTEFIDIISNIIEQVVMPFFYQLNVHLICILSPMFDQINEVFFSLLTF